MQIHQLYQRAGYWGQRSAVGHSFVGAVVGGGPTTCLKVLNLDRSRCIRVWRGRRPTGSGWRRIIADRLKLKAVSALFPVSDCRVWSISYADCGAINNIPL